MNSSDIDSDAKIIWDYLQMSHPLRPCDAIFVPCSTDVRGAERAAELFKDGYGKYIVVSGGSGKLSKDLFREPEAQIFAKIMVANGVPADKIIVEDKAANTGENIRFVYKLLQEKDLHPRSLMVVPKPYMERRTYATFKKQWPDPDTEIILTSPQIPYEKYFNEACPKDLVLNLMVGDLQRIREYAVLGYQIEQDIPLVVWEAYERLVAAGYDEQVIQDTHY